MKNKLFLFFFIGFISLQTFSQCLSGDCYNGNSSYRFPNGDIYTGNYVNGLQVGSGVYKYNSGEIYTGSFFNGMFKGYGEYKFPNGDVYSGSFLNGTYDGYGELKYASGRVDKGKWQNGNLVNDYNQISNAQKKGEPELVSNSNSNVVQQQNGCISGNCIDGYGIYYFSNGDYYKGDYVNGYRTGKGYYKWSNGNEYEGEFLYNTQNGKGIFKWINGDSYEGDFVNNKMQGFGIYYFYNRDNYEGDWVSGVKQGQGKYTYASGIIEEGKWVNNTFVSSNTNNYKVAQGNSSYSGSGSTNNNNSQSSTNPMKDIQDGFKELVNNPLIKGMLAQEVKLSNSGVNVNGEKCKKCKIVLKTPKNRACYICNRQFSGWGFIKKSYGITLEHEESLSSCFPEIGNHNYKCWIIHEDACCSRQCAMKL